MSYLDTALGIAGAAGQMYGGWGQKPQQVQGQQPHRQGLLMQYLQYRKQHQKPTGMQPNGTTAPTPGVPVGQMPPPGPLPPVGAGPQAPPSPAQDLDLGVQQSPANPYDNPYPLKPPGTMDPDAPPPGTADPRQQQGYAHGGIITKPTTALIGEDGPEMVIPLSGRRDAKVSPRNLPHMNYARR